MTDEHGPPSEGVVAGCKVDNNDPTVLRYVGPATVVLGLPF